MPDENTDKAEVAVAEPVAVAVKENAEVEQKTEDVKDAQPVQTPKTDADKQDKITDSPAYKGIQRTLAKTQAELAEAKKGSLEAASLKQEIAELKADMRQILDIQKANNDYASGKMTEEQHSKRVAEIEKAKEQATIEARVAVFAKAVSEAGLDLKDPELQKWTNRYATPEAALEDLPLYVAKVKGKDVKSVKAEEPAKAGEQPDVKKLQAENEYLRKRLNGELDGEIPGGPSAAGVNTANMSPEDKIRYGLSKAKK